MSSKEPRPLPPKTDDFNSEVRPKLASPPPPPRRMQYGNAEHIRLMEQNKKLTADNARLTAELSELRRLVNRHDHDYLAVHKELDKAHAENVSLRELLQTFKHRLDKRWREGTRQDSYSRGYQDGLEAAEVIFDDVFKAAIEKGE